MTVETLIQVRAQPMLITGIAFCHVGFSFKQTTHANEIVSQSQSGTTVHLMSGEVSASRAVSIKRKITMKSDKNENTSRTNTRPAWL